MKDHKLAGMKNRQAKATKEISEFYRACVPYPYREDFKPIAEKFFPDLLKECEELKQSPQDDIRQYCVDREIFVRKSKELIRRAAFKLYLIKS